MNIFKSNFIRFWFPVILYSGIIFYASSFPDVKTPLAKFEFDKILHIIEYAPFGFLLARAMQGTGKMTAEWKLWALVIGVTVFYALGDEIHQSFVHGRNSGGFDLIADVIGSALGGYLYLFKKTKFKKHS